MPVIPQATTDLVVTQRAAKIVLTWSFPSLTTSGRSLPAIRRISVYRYVEPLPPSATIARDTTPQEPAVSDAVSAFARVPTVTAAQFVKLSQKIDSIESANLASATIGSKLTYEDTPPFQPGRPIRVTYSIVTEGVTARGDLSNLVSIVPLPVAVAPAGLTATALPEGVLLKWNEPKASATGPEQPVIVG